MDFIDPNNVTHTTPPDPIVVLGINSFIILLNDKWTFPLYKNWDLAVATQTTGGSWSNWVYSQSSTLASTTFIPDDITVRYQFRYKVNTKTAVSPWSTGVSGGQPKIIGIQIIGGVTTYVIQEYSG